MAFIAHPSGQWADGLTAKKKKKVMTMVQWRCPFTPLY